MKLGLVSSTLLYLAAWTGNVYSTNGPLASCCLKVSNTRVHVDFIVDYRNQSSTRCGITAVVFTTNKGIRICANPTGNWTQRAIGKVNADRTAVTQENVAEAGGAGRASTVRVRDSLRPMKQRLKPVRLRTNRGKSCKRRISCRNRRRKLALRT